MNNKKRYKWDDNNRPLYPVTKTDYVKRGGRWIPVNQETELLSLKQTGYILDNKHGLPFESSHRFEKYDKSTKETYDTFSSISPDRTKKSTWFVDFAQGRRNYRKILDKASYDRMRYRKLKEKRLKGE